MTGEELIILSGNLINNNIITWTALPLSYDSISYLDLLRDILARPIFTSLLMWIRWIVCLCIVFKKANRQRREALIPVRIIRIIFQISWMKKAFWFCSGVSFLFVIICLYKKCKKEYLLCGLCCILVDFESHRAIALQFCHICHRIA